MVCIKEIALTKDTDDEFALIKWLGTRYYASILYTNLTVTKALVLDILSKKSFVYT